MNKFFTYIFSLMSLTIYGQIIFGPQQVLIDDLQSVQNIAVADIQGNGFLDILATGFFETRIVLIENSENGFENIDVIIEGDTPRGITAIDINGDQHLDLAYSIDNSSTLQYILNNGNGQFSNPTTVATGVLNIFDLKAVDLNGDDRKDILLASTGVMPRWYENVSGTFPIEHIIDGPAGRSLEAGDLDNDGDLDIVSTASGNQTCVWYENLGDGTFSSVNIIRGAGAASSSVFISDLNGDTKLDILLTVNGNETVSWFENFGDGTFGDETIIDNTLETALRVIAADLDNDGDADVIANSFNDIFSFENLDGQGTFGEKTLVTAEVWAPFYTIAADFDNDGDLDLASASRNDSTVAWYENLTILGVNGPKAVKFEVYPNPSTSYFVIQVTPGSATGFTLYDMQGKLLQRYPAATTTIDARSLPSGVYMLALKTASGNEMYQKLIKK